MTDTSDDFDWGDVEDNIVQQAVEKVAIYSNPAYDVVIRQERRWDEERDTFIVISRGYVLRAAYAILEAAGLGEICFHRAVAGGYEDVPIQASVAAMMASRPDLDWKAVNEAANAAGLSDEREDPDEVSIDPRKLPLRERRAKAEAALLADQKRSNRSVAAECGLSDKTVGAIRLRMGLEPDGAEGSAEIARDSAEFRRDDDQFRLIAAE